MWLGPGWCLTAKLDGLYIRVVSNPGLAKSTSDRGDTCPHSTLRLRLQTKLGQLLEVEFQFSRSIHLVYITSLQVLSSLCTGSTAILSDCAGSLVLVAECAGLRRYSKSLLSEQVTKRNEISKNLALRCKWTQSTTGPKGTLSKSLNSFRETTIRLN